MLARGTSNSTRHDSMPDLSLRLGTAKVDITPRAPLQLAGFEVRRGNFEYVAHPLHLRVLFFEQDAEDGKLRRALVASADLLWWGPDRVGAIFERLSERWGIDRSMVVLNGSHSHSGPQTSARFARSIGEPDLDYLEFLEARLFEGIDLAAANLESVQVARGRGTCRIAINRRAWIDGAI